ncbi:MAG: hypothetical protein JWP62_1514 [Blastococcus sp.]|nr:hypothetical protein [Blastococcus sp.]
MSEVPRRPGPRRALPRPVLVAAAGGLVVVPGVALVAARAGVPQAVVLPHWWGDWPSRQPGQLVGWVAAGVLLLGALCAAWTWLGLFLLRPVRTEGARAYSDRGRGDESSHRWRVRGVTGLAVAWSLPLLVTGPVGSLDVQSYAAVGRLAAIGLDPYHATPGRLTDSYGAAVDPGWRWTPTPYGPLQVALLRGVALVAGHQVGTAVLLIRGVAVLGLAAGLVLAVRAVPLTDRVPVLLITALNPVVLVHVVSGAHLDVLVGALAVLVVGLARSGRPATAMGFAVVACAVKLPGAVLMAFVLLDVLRTAPGPDRPRTLLRVVGAGLGTLGAVVALCPDPFGWVGALGVPGKAHNGTAPSTWMSYLAAAVTQPLPGHAPDPSFTVGRTVTAVIGAAVACFLLWRATSGSRSTAFWGVGWALVAVALTGPALYPWYLTWGLFAVAIGSGLVGRLVLMGLSSAACLAAAMGSDSVVVVTWVVVMLAVLGFTAWVGHALLANRSAGLADVRTEPLQESPAHETARRLRPGG